MLVFHLPCIKDTRDTVQLLYGKVSGTVTFPTDAASPFYYSMQLGSGWADIFYTPVLNKTTKLSIAFWYKSGPVNNNASFLGIIRLRTQSDAYLYDFRLENISSAENNYSWFNNGAEGGNFTNASGVYNGADTLARNTWYHYVFSVDLETGKWEKWVTPLNGTTVYTTNSITPNKQCYFVDYLQIQKVAQIDYAQYADIRVYDNLISEYEVRELLKRPICHYTFDYPDSTKYNYATDVTGMGNNAEAVNINLSNDCKIGITSAQFDGAQYVTLPAQCKIPRFTANMWAYMDNWTQYVEQRIISCTEGGGWNIEGSAGEIHMSCYDGIANTYKTTGSYSTSNLTPGWHMFTCQFDGTNAKFYIDAVQVATSVNYQGTPKGYVGYNAGNRIFLGCEAAGNTSPGGNYFKGKIDDFKMWASALSIADIETEYTTRAIIDNKYKLHTGRLNLGLAGYSKYNLVILDKIAGSEKATKCAATDMNWYEFSLSTSTPDPMVRYNTKIPRPIAGHLYYGAIVFRTLPGFTCLDNRFEWYLADRSTALMVFAHKANTDGYAKRFSSIQTLAAPEDGTWWIRNFVVNPTTKSWVSDPIIVDLTDLFGKGNEPDKDWCDKNISLDPINLISDPSFENSAVSDTHNTTINGTYADVVDYDAYEGTKSLEMYNNGSTWPECCSVRGYASYFRPMHKYYWGVWVKRMAGTTSTGGQIYMQPGDIAEPNQGNFTYGPADGNWYWCSFITFEYNFTNMPDTWKETYAQANLRIDFDGNGMVRYDNLTQIDLTALYGWGNEPSLEECDRRFGQKNYKIQLADINGITQARQITHYGRPMRYIRISSNGSNMNSATNHIISLYASTVDNGKIKLLNAPDGQNDRSKIKSGSVGYNSGSNAHYDVSSPIVFDIGKVDFVSSIWMKRYYYDNRVYYGTKLEGSIDNATYFTIWDSHNTGSYGNNNAYNLYTETSEGRTFTVRADNFYLTPQGSIIANEITTNEETTFSERTIIGFTGLTRSDSQLTWTDDIASLSKWSASTSGNYVTVTSPLDKVFPFNKIHEVKDNNDNVFISFPKVWMKWIKDSSGNIDGVKFASYQADSSYFIPNAFADPRDSNKASYLDEVWIGKYEGSGDSSRMYSKSGQTLLASLTISQFRTAARSYGSSSNYYEGYQQYDSSIMTLYNFLCMLYYKTGNIQSVYAGRTNTSALTSSGGSDGISSLNGWNTSTTCVKMLGVENPYGNMPVFIDGMFFKQQIIYVCYFPQNYTDSDTSTSTALSFNRPSSDGFVQYLHSGTGDYQSIVYPSAVTSSETTYFGDKVSYNTDTVNTPMIGGDYDDKSVAGLWNFYGHNEPSDKWTNAGARLCRRPISLMVYIVPMCFVDGTLIWTVNGLKPIETIQEGEQVYSFNEETSTIEVDTIVKKYESTQTDFCTFALEDNTEIKVTPKHKFYCATSNSWVPAEQLTINDELFTAEGNSIKIMSIIKQGIEPTHVTNFMLKNNHNFFITKNCILVHNVIKAG